MRRNSSLAAGGARTGSAPGCRAFTFVELTIVMCIIAVLAAIAVSNFLEAKTRAVVARSRSDLAVIKMALGDYRVEYDAYPLNSVPGRPEPWDLTVLTTPASYLAVLPLDAFTVEEGRTGRHPIPLPPIPYRFFNALQIDEEHGLGVFKFADPAAGEILASGLAAGLLWGYGPDSLAIDYKPAPVLDAASLEFRSALYDPTNGTVSRGDIITRVP